MRDERMEALRRFAEREQAGEGGRPALVPVEGGLIKKLEELAAFWERDAETRHKVDSIKNLGSALFHASQEIATVDCRHAKELREILAKHRGT